MRKHIKKPKKPKKIKERTRWAKFSKDFRSGKSCAICGSSDYLNVHHLIARHVLKSKFKYEPNNLIVLCANCHKFAFKGAHQNPIWFARWLDLHLPEHYKWVLEVTRLEYLKGE